MKKLSKEQFIKNAKSVYGDRYIYSNVVFENTKKPVEIICRNHGSFWQTPNGHIYQGGCGACRYISSSRKLMKTTEQFLVEAKNVHGDRYDYSNTKYIGAHKKVSIFCRIHGEFFVSPHSHLKGGNCAKCRKDGDGAKKSRLGFDGFVKKANKVHCGTYEYPEFEYKNTSEKAKIICKVHGEFEQIIGNHIAGSGCFSCKPSGFDSSKTGFLYVLMSDEFFKVGISSKIRWRIARLKKSTPFNFSLVLVMQGFGAHVRKCEKSIHRKFQSAGFSGFEGCTEWFKIETMFMDKVVQECIENGLERFVE